MKLKIERERLPSGNYYYVIYERVWFCWVYHPGHYDTLEEAEECAVRILEEEIERKIKKETPVYYQLDEGRITYKKGDGIERGIMGKPPLKLKKTENQK